MNLQELKALAEAVNKSPMTSKEVNDYFQALKPETILKMIAVMEQMAKLMEEELHTEDSPWGQVLTAYKEFGK